ncbi:hypothetical protein BMT67_24605, partial [Escherichia coli]
MSTDKEKFALYCEAKNDKVRKRLGIKGGFYWTTAKKLSVAISRCITAMDDNDGNDSNLLIVFYVQIMPDDFVMQLHR